MDISNQDKEWLLDYCLGIASEDQITRVEALMAANPEAARIFASFQGALSPLGTLESDPCPDDLAERTVTRLREAAAQERLEGLLLAERGPRTIKVSWWRNVAQVAAVAAIVVFLVGIIIPSFGFARSIYLRNRCQMELARIYDGLSSYTTDHDGQLPAVATSDGSPWWKVGYQGKENHSNTRPVWLLVRQGYVAPARFICPGTADKPELAKLNVADYCDFPDKRYVRYSFRIPYDRPKGAAGSANVLMSDRNPLAERLPADFSQPFRIRLDRNMLMSNSLNHRGTGQNVLRGDGGVQFVKTRFVGVSKDDIFATGAMTSGSDVVGCETPCGVLDAFLAP